MRVVIVLALAALPLAGCQKSVEGTYNLENGPVAGVVTTFGPRQFAMSSGPGGTYERKGDTVILTGPSFNGTFRVEGDKLVGDRFTFVRRSPDDNSPIYRGPRAGYGSGGSSR
jgi:hypothetical protein